MAMTRMAGNLARRFIPPPVSNGRLRKQVVGSCRHLLRKTLESLRTTTADIRPALIGSDIGAPIPAARALFASRLLGMTHLDLMRLAGFDIHFRNDQKHWQIPFDFFQQPKEVCGLRGDRHPSLLGTADLPG